MVSSNARHRFETPSTHSFGLVNVLHPLRLNLLLFVLLNFAYYLHTEQSNFQKNHQSRVIAVTSFHTSNNRQMPK